MKCLLLLILPVTLCSQTAIKGVIKNSKNNSPIPFTYIGIKDKDYGCIADSTGKFSLQLAPHKINKDTVIVSAIGFHTVFIALSDLKKNEAIYLSEKVTELTPVSVNALTKYIILGDTNTRGLSFSMGIGNEGSGGETGNELHIPASSFQLLKVFVRVSTTYDTCWYRLHIRKMENNLPGDDLLNENIVISSTLKKGWIEFDLSASRFFYREKVVFVGIELLKHSVAGSQSKTKGNYMVFTGREPAKYRSFHKWYSHLNWAKGENHSFSIKLHIRH